MPIEYNVIGKHIRAARKRSGMTQEAVAEAIDMSAAHYGKVERGDRKINLDRLSQLSQLFAIPLESLVEGAVILHGEALSLPTDSIASKASFLKTIEQIISGCSDEALQLMTRLCKDVADADRGRRFP